MSGLMIVSSFTFSPCGRQTVERPSSRDATMKLVRACCGSPPRRNDLPTLRITARRPASERSLS